MKTSLLLLSAASSLAFAADPALTIYNGGYAVVREMFPVELKAGLTEVAFAGVTSALEADTVLLRDLAGKAEFRILEQSYRNDPVTQSMLLSMFEGKSLEFVQREANKPDRNIIGKVVRSGYRRGQHDDQPIIEVDGKLLSQIGQKR